jgi:hypothetical protein
VAHSTISPQSAAAIKAILKEGELSNSKAIDLAIATARIDSQFDVHLLQAVCDSSRPWPEGVPEFEMNRALDVVKATARNLDRIRLLLLRFLRVPQTHVRARMAALSAILRPNDSWFNALMMDTDGRVRANAVEAIAEFPLTSTRKRLLESAAQDPHHRVRTTALYVLSKNGDGQALATLHAIIAQGPDKFRRGAAWALVKLGQGIGRLKRPAA